jgi:hypothetical protein
MNIAFLAPGFLQRVGYGITYLSRADYLIPVHDRKTEQQKTQKKPQMSVLLTLSVNNISTALGLRPQTPAYAPPLAGFSMSLPVAYNHNDLYLHEIIK